MTRSGGRKKNEREKRRVAAWGLGRQQVEEEMGQWLGRGRWVSKEWRTREKKIKRERAKRKLYEGK